MRRAPQKYAQQREKLHLQGIFKKITIVKIEKHLVTNHYWNLDAATPI